MGIHIREFNKYGDTYYPSYNGLTLQPEQFTVCFKHGPPTSIFDIAEINLALESVNPDTKREFYILMADDGKYSLTKETTCRSGRVYKWPIDITFSQWRAIQKVEDDVITSFIAIKYKSRDLLETFKTVSKCVIPVEKPLDNFEYAAAESKMNNILTIVLYKNIGEKKGIKPPIRIGDETIELSELVSVKDFNESCLYLNVVSVVRDFEKELIASKNYHSRQSLMEFLSEQYLKNIHLDVCIEHARKDFCSEEF